jgi:hypothetical protein
MRIPPIKLAVLVASTAAVLAAPLAAPAPRVGPTAKFRDRTYSYSHHRRGTCGVAKWLRNVPVWNDRFDVLRGGFLIDES